MAQDHRALSWEEVWLRKEPKKKILGLASLQHTIARQQSRVLWISEGDANTSFSTIMLASGGGETTCSSLGSVTDRPQIRKIWKTSRLNSSRIYGETEGQEWTVSIWMHCNKTESGRFRGGILCRRNMACHQKSPSEQIARPWRVHCKLFSAMLAYDQSWLHGSHYSSYQTRQRKLPVAKPGFHHVVAKKRGCIGHCRVQSNKGFAKVFSKALATRVYSRLNQLIVVNQCAFVKGRSI